MGRRDGMFGWLVNRRPGVCVCMCMGVCVYVDVFIYFYAHPVLASVAVRPIPKPTAQS